VSADVQHSVLTKKEAFARAQGYCFCGGADCSVAAVVVAGVVVACVVVAGVVAAGVGTRLVADGPHCEAIVLKATNKIPNITTSRFIAFHLAKK